MLDALGCSVVLMHVGRDGMPISANIADLVSFTNQIRKSRV